MTGGERVREYEGVHDARTLEPIAAGAAVFLALRHPHLYPVHAIDVGRSLCVRGPTATELFEIAALRDHVLGLVAQIAQAVGALHERAIVHLAISRQAIGCVAEDGWGWRAVLMDSEVARPTDATGHGIGLPPSPAPELRDGRFDVRTDVYGIGVLLHELVSPAVTGPRNDPTLDAVLARLLANDPDRRPSTIADVLAELESLGWQRTLPLEPQPYDRIGHHQLVFVRPSLQMQPLDRRRATVWARRWTHDSCELWKYQDAWFIAPQRDRTVRIGTRLLRYPDRVPLRIGEVVTTDEATFLLAPVDGDAGRNVERTLIPPWPSDRPDRRAAPPPPTQSVLESTMVRCSSCGELTPLRYEFCVSCGQSRAAAPAVIARRIGDWQIIGDLGSGATTETFRVHRNGITGVAKRLLPEAYSNPTMRTRFEREVSVLRDLRHVAIPRLLDHGTDYDLRVGGLPYLVMEDVGEQSLADRLQDGSLDLSEAVATIRDVLAALDAAHARQIIHRDLKPSNVVLPPPGGFAKLLDFGVAHVSARAPDEDEITGTGALVGTPVYMSPEQVRGEEVTPASDVYGAGCLLYEMLSGSAPYAGLGTAELMHAHVHVPPPALRSSVPSELADVVMRMLAKEPASRPSCREARALLAPFVAQSSSSHGSRGVEIEPGIWRWTPTNVTVMGGDEVWMIGIDKLDRRDGPRLRLHALEQLARECPPGFVSVRSKDEPASRVFEVCGPPPIEAGTLSNEQALAAVLGAYVVLDRAGQHYHRLDRKHLRGSVSSPQTFRIVLDVIDDDMLLAPDAEARGCEAALEHLFEKLLPDGAREQLDQLSTERIEDLLANLEPAWRDAIDRLRDDQAFTPTDTIPPHAAPPEAPFALPAADESVSAAPHGDLGRLLGNWRIVRLLGAGGFGSVYQVENVKIGKRAVAKLLAPHAANIEHVRSRFIDEARAVNRFQHPNIIDVFDWGDDAEGRPYIVMEHLAGETLQERLTRGALTVQDAVEITRQTASGLGAAHAAGIVHRDIKPANVVVHEVADSTRVKIIDFGIARVPRTEFQTDPDQIMGSPAYMPPEQWIGAGQVDARSDIYALGVMLFEMLTGAPPFTGQLTELREQTIHAPVPRLRSPHGAIPDRLEELVRRMLAKHRDDRPQSCDAVISALDELAPPRASSTDDELKRAGFTNIVSDGTTAEAIPRYLARDARGSVTLYLAQPDLRGLRATARIGALRYLFRERPTLFVPIEKELVLPSRSTLYVRRDPVPPALRVGVALATGPALAIVAVTYRALALLRAAGRSFENFALEQVRAAVEDPAQFACMLQPPQVFERGAQEAVTMAGNEYVGNIYYASSEQLMGRERPYDVAYCVGVLAYELLAGAPPFVGLTWYEVSQRKASEDPPKLAARRDVPKAVAAFIDGLIARDPKSRSRPPALVEAELLALLAAEPAWQAAAERVLASAPPLSEVAWNVDAQPASRAATPALSTGERVGAWTVASHVRFGGDAEVYLVTDDHSNRAILKLWYAELDPYSEDWSRFRRGMLECAKRPGFPSVRELEIIVRERPRAFAVFEEIVGKDWRTLVMEGPPPAPFLLELGAQLLATLEDAHAQLGAVGDVSPTNIIVRDDAARTPILLDVMTPGRARDQIKGYGTAGYIAPEVTNGEPPSRLSDVFSAGVLIAELAIGKRMFPEIVEGLSFPVGGFERPIATAIEQVRGTFGSAFAAVLGRMLASDPSKRYASAGAAAEELREIAARVRVREASRQMSESSTLLGLERRLPRPLAQALRSWRIAEDPQWRVRFGFGLAELVTRYLAAIALADYLSGTPLEAVEKELPALRRPSFGTWLSVARSTARALADRGSPFVPELVELFAAKSPGLAAIEALIPLRNKYSHGIPVIPDGDLEEVVGQVTRHVRAILTAIRFLGSYPLLLSEEQRTLRDGRFDGIFIDLHGAASEPEHRRLQSFHAAATGVVMMTSPDLQERLIVEPFLAHRACKACGAVSHTYVMAEVLDKGDVKYLDQISGHEHRERPVDAAGAARPLFELISNREQLGLRGPLAVAAADGERFWRGDSPVKPGQDLDGVVLEEEIGRGAMGVVYRAKERKLDRPCAVKIVRPEVLGEDRKPLHRLQDEARKLARLEHPHVVRVFHFGVTPDENNCFIVMELLEGGSLEDRLRSGQPLPFDEVLGLSRQLVDAVNHMHAAEIVHRDLKPANVLFAARDTIKVVDFGMARDLRATSTRTVGFGGATPHYCSPEQLAGGAIGPWTDVYALGLMLYDLAIGQPASLDPQRRAAAIRTCAKQARKGERVEHLAQHGSDARLADFLAALVTMTEMEPERRPSITAVHLQAPPN